MKTQVCTTFKLGNNPRVTQQTSTVCLSFFVEGEEIAIEFGTNHTRALRRIIGNLQKIAIRSKAVRKKPSVKTRALPAPKEEKPIIAVDF